MSQSDNYNFPVRMTLESCSDIHPQLFQDGDILHHVWGMQAFALLPTPKDAPPTFEELDWIVCPCCGWGRGPRSPRSLTKLRFARE